MYPAGKSRQLVCQVFRPRLRLYARPPCGKYPYPHDRLADKDSYPHDSNVTDDLCSLIKLCFAFMDLLWLIFRLNMFIVIHVEYYLL